MAFDMRGELFGNRDELLREQSDRFLESLGLITEISLVDCLNSQISALQAENAKLRAQLTWRPVSEEPTLEIEDILCKRMCRFNGKDFTRLYPTRLNEIGDWERFVAKLEITTWLPIPPMKEDNPCTN